MSGSWVGPFYPPGTEPADFLRLYAEHFRTVEVDVTYYRVPDARLVEGWKSRTPEGFVLSAKFPRSVVHCGAGPQPDAAKLLLPDHCRQDTDAFLAAMGRLGPKCGPLALQFPLCFTNTHLRPCWQVTRVVKATQRDACLRIAT